jgi:hypothetical protein
MPSWKKVITSGSDAHLKTINTDGNISGSSVSTGSFGRVETSTISGLSPLIIESDNVNVDSDGSVSGSSVSTGSFGKVSTGTVRASQLRLSKNATEASDTTISIEDFGGGNKLTLSNGATSLVYDGRLGQNTAGLNFNVNFSGMLGNAAATATNPSIKFTGDTDTGLGRADANQLSLITGGTEAFRVTSTLISGSSTSTGSFGKVEATTLKGTLETAAQGNVTSLGTLTTLTVDDITLNGSTISDSGDLTMDVGGDLVIDVDGTDVILKDGGTAFGRFKRDSSDFIIKSEANNEDIILRGQDGGSTIDALLLDMSEAGSALFNSDISGSTIRASGDIIAFNSSDERLKDNVEPIKFPLDKLGKIGGYTFDWNDKQQIYHGHDVGVLAQEIEEVLPEAVKDRGSGYKGVQYDKIIPLLIEGIKELKEKVKHIEENCDCLKK